MKYIIPILIIRFYSEGVLGKLELIDHGYEDLLISISPDIPADRAQLIIGIIMDNVISETCHTLILIFSSKTAGLCLLSC